MVQGLVMNLSSPPSGAGDFKDTRADGSPRRVLFSDHAVERIRQRLPTSHVFKRLSDQALADRIERTVLDLSRFNPPVLVQDPQGEGYQWELDLSPRLNWPLVAVLKDTGSWGNALPDDQRILVTVIMGQGYGRRARLSQLAVRR